jgi:HEAT repeat protein
MRALSLAVLLALPAAAQVSDPFSAAKSADAGDRRGAAEALAPVSGPRAVAALEGLLADPDVAVRLTAAEPRAP